MTDFPPDAPLMGEFAALTGHAVIIRGTTSGILLAVVDLPITGMEGATARAIADEGLHHYLGVSKTQTPDEGDKDSWLAPTGDRPGTIFPDGGVTASFGTTTISSPPNTAEAFKAIEKGEGRTAPRDTKIFVYLSLIHI